MKVNSLIVAFFEEKPPCSSATCPEMRASEWQYLCAVHDPPKSCCAIDYCCHTLDWAANVLTSQKSFPSRLTLGTDTAGGSQQGLRQLTNIFRRVYRIFAHAWFQHRQAFWEVEGKEGLYILFKTVCDAYNLIPEENYTISPEAEGITSSPEEEKEGKAVIRKAEDDNTKIDDLDAPNTVARRHKATPSTGAVVATIAEGDEDDHVSFETTDKEKDAPVLSSEHVPRETDSKHSKSVENTTAENAHGTSDKPTSEPVLETVNLDGPADAKNLEEVVSKQEKISGERVEPEEPKQAP